MALTLNSTLQTAQDGITRHPLCEITSGQLTNPIPFDGQYFNDYTPNEVYPALIVLESGRLAGAYGVEGAFPSQDELYYLYSDTDRQEWTATSVLSLTGIEKISLCELENGNVGLVWVEYGAGGTDRLRYMVLGPTGSVVTAAATIASYDDDDYWVNDPHVVNMDGNYNLFYAHNDIAANDGSGEYNIMRRVSSGDFTSWGAEENVPIDGGLLETRRKGNPFYLRTVSGEQNDLFFFDYVDELRPDGAEVANIYKCETDDAGTTFTSGEQLTTFDTYGYSAKHPTAGLDPVTETVKFAYQEEITVLHADVNSPGYSGSDYIICPYVGPTNLHFDPATRYLYASFIYNSIGSKSLCSVARIDVDTWTIEKCYTNLTSPAYDDFFAENSVMYGKDKGGGHWVCHHGHGVDTMCIVAINDEDETIKEYYFEDDVAYGFTKNIDVDWRGHYSTLSVIQATAVDADNDRVYVYIMTNGYYAYHWFGYIDLTETADPSTGKYTFHEVFYENLGTYQGVIDCVFFDSMILVPEAGYVVLAYNPGSVGSYKGRLRIFNMINGSEIKDYIVDDFSGFPYRGVYRPVYYDGYIYASFHYEELYGQSDRKGLFSVNLATNEMSYIVPSFATLDDYLLYSKTVTNDGRIIMTTGNYGVQIYDIAAGTWTEYSNSEIINFTSDGSDIFPYSSDVAYDEENGTIFAARGWDYRNPWDGLLAINETGYFNQMQYKTGTFTTDWSFDTENILTLYTLDYDGHIAIDSEAVIWMLWTRLDGTEESLKWDRSGASFDLSNYLTGNVETTWNIEGPNQLSFSCSHGHLFDPNNDMSTLSPYLKRGRTMTLRLGELINDIEYWQNQGVFVVKSVRLSYERGKYPEIAVECEDMTYIWSEGVIPATEYFDNEDPEAVLATILEDHGYLDSDDYSLPEEGAMENSHTIYYQWLDTNLMDMLLEILNHFEYIPYMDVNGDFTIKQIDFDKSPDHTYSDNTQIISYSPDDSFSSYVNRVTVKGEGRYDLEVLYPEEHITDLSGTTGWYGCHDTFRVYYSPDESRTVRNPRLVEVEGLTGNSFFTDWFGNINAYISDEDGDETWVDVTVDIEDLVEPLIVALGLVVVIGTLASKCDYEGTVFSTCGFYIMALSLAMEAASMILGVMQNYNYEIWGQPTGHEKQTFQASSDDEELQNELNGMIITEELDDPFCYTIAECARVAEYEMDVVKHQRRRAKFTKITHLQDEITDMIQIVHPYSTNDIKVLITNLRRTYTPAIGPNEGGGVFDEIEGWRITS